LVKTLPESIGNLTDLQYLILTDNPSIEKIPASVVKLQDLVFINLQRSNRGVEIPAEVKELLEDSSDGFYAMK
jgi:Leucine-rich repeat (LRR) protein